MRNLRLLIQFDGTDFCGWQMQATDRTVQGELTAALGRLLGQPVTLNSSSRTDAGVHALEMPVNFRVDTALPLKAFVLGLNSLLPPDLKVLDALDVPWDFHARFSARGKTYVYRVLTGRIPLPMERRTAWHVPVPLDLPAMQDAASRLVGRHDFSAFRAAHCDAASPVKEVRKVEVRWERPGELLAIEVEARSFLRNMVRILAGTLVDVGAGRHAPGWVTELLEHGDRTRGGQTAPARGLFLVKVHYPDPQGDARDGT